MIELRVEVKSGNWQSIERVELNKICYLVGRDRQCDIYLGDIDFELRKFLSKIHCCLFRRSSSAKDKYGRYLEAGYDLVDGYKGVASKNGTYLNQTNERIIGKINLRHGDTIYFSDRLELNRLRLIYSNPEISVTSDLEDTLIDS